MRRRAVSAVLAAAMSVAAVVSFFGGNDPHQASAAGAPVVPDGLVQPLPRSIVTVGDRAIAPPPDEFDAPAEATAPPPQQLINPFLGAAPTGGTWAVMVGVNDYPGSRHDLRSAVNDVRDVDAALDGYGVPRARRLVITDRQASADTIRRSAQWLTAHASPDATVVFFFAGHVRKLGRGTEALVGADGQVVTDHELASLLAPLAAKHAWIGIAGCYGGGFTEVAGPRRVVTGAAPANSLAYENEGFGRSYMVEYMVNRAMIQGHAPHSVEQSFAWAHAELSRDYPHRLPVQIDGVHGELALGALPAVAPAPRPQEHRAAPSDGARQEGGSGGGSSAGDQPPAPQPAPRPTTCQQLTLGVVSCND